MNKTTNIQKNELRQKILATSKLLHSLTYKLGSIKSITKGSIYMQTKKCGNKKCKCTQGQLHNSELLSFSHKGKTKLISLAKYSIAELFTIKKEVKNYKKFRRNRAKIVACFKTLLTDINTLEKYLLSEKPQKGGTNVKKKE